MQRKNYVFYWFTYIQIRTKIPPDSARKYPHFLQLFLGGFEFYSKLDYFPRLGNRGASGDLTQDYKIPFLVTENTP